MRRLRFVVVAVLALAACGGGDDDDDVGEPETTTTAPPVSGAVDLVVTGEPTPFEAADGRSVDLEVGADGTCSRSELALDDSEPSFALCQVVAPFAIVTVSRATDDHDTGILCADGDGFTLLATAIGTGTPVTTTLELEGVGTVALLSVHDGFVGDATSAEAVLVAQPAGAPCPVLHGVGAVLPGVERVRNPLGVIEVDGPDGTSCTTYDGEAFVTGGC